MQTLILPGGSPQNKTWLDECAEKLKVEGIVRPVTWDHWLDSNEKFDPKEKGTLISRHTKGDKFSIVAKSIGCLVASYVISTIPDKIEKVIFNGIPVTDLNLEEKQQIVKALLLLNKNKVVVFQNDEDPHGSFVEVRGFIPSTVSIVSKEATNHDYPYYDDFNEFLSK